MLCKLRQMFKGNQGQGMMEYAMIILVVVIVIYVAAKAFGNTASTKISAIASQIPT